MLYREVPKNGDKLSVLGYGCMRFPMRMGKINAKLAEKQIMYALEQGVNYFDTAYPYHNGKSEPFLGEVLSKNNCRNKVKIATKLPHWITHSTEDMDKVLDEQLSKLKTDHIDYYLVHALNGEFWNTAKQNGVIEFLEKSLKSGKIINAGFSFHGFANEFNPIVDDFDWTFCQIQYNYLDTKNQAGRNGLRYAASKDIAVIIMEPLRGGNLAKTPPPSVQQIWAKADQKKTPAEWALRWLWNQPEVTVVLSGMNTDSHISENLRIAEESLPKSLSEKEVKLVEEAADEFQKIMKVGCTGCQYCMPCPVEVNIPSCFAWYNSYHAFKDKSAKIMYLVQNGGVFSDKVTLASKCVKCGKCIEKCPQHLAIPKLLK